MCIYAMYTLLCSTVYTFSVKCNMCIQQTSHTITMVHAVMELLAILALTLLSPVHTATVYYVVSSDNSTANCPTEPQGVVCHDLSYYVEQQDQYFVSDVTFMFFDGKHILDKETLLTVSARRINLQSNSFDYTPLITCARGETGIAIINSTDIVIENIAVSNCGGVLSDFSDLTNHMYIRNRLNQYSQTVSLAIVNTTNIALRSLHISNSRNMGLLVINGYNITVTSSVFIDNYPNVILLYTALDICDTDASVNVTISLSDSRFMRGGLGVDLFQGCSYMVDMTLDSLLLHGSQDDNMDINITDYTLYTLRATNITSTGAKGAGLSIVTQDDSTLAQLPCCPSLPSQTSESTCPIVFKHSQFSNNNVEALRAGGIFLYLFSQAQACDQSIIFESCNIDGNYGRYAGVGILQKTNMANIVLRNVSLNGNVPTHVSYTSAIAMYSTDILMENVSICNTPQSAILTFSSQITFKGTHNYIKNNHGLYGGGIGMHENSAIHLADETTAVILHNNSATVSGGAIYIGESSFLFSLSNCFASVKSEENFQNGGIYFSNNTARFGSDIFGLSSGQCYNVPRDVFKPPLDQLSLSSPPLGLCSCSLEKNTFNCSSTLVPLTGIYPGQMVNLYVVPVGSGNDDGFAPTRSTSIRVLYDGREVDRFTSNEGCTLLRYRTSAYSSTSDVPINITLTTADLGASHHDLTILFNFTDCPLGLHLSPNGTCECDDIFKGVEGLVCNAETGKFSYKGSDWIGTMKYNGALCIGKALCPNDYCRSDDVSFFLNDTDAQCQFNRHGVTCGGCRPGYSLMLGTNMCGRCSDGFLSLFIVFALAGVGLVGLLVILDLTVSVGTINGLIFYCNIVKICEPFFFPTGRIVVLSHFIAWLNLDFGFSSCFYEQFDPFAKAWLQFAFPIYIWLIVLLIIYACRKSSTLSRLLGNQAVPVLATLILLSYIKMVRIVSDAIGYTKVTLLSCSNVERYVWYNNGNVPFLTSKQGLLFAFGVLILLLFCIPYAILLTCSDRTRYFLARCGCTSWWIKVKPFLDAYNSPYLDNCRFWPGLLLLLRLVVLLLLAIAGAPTIPVLVALTGGIIVLSAMLKGVYHKWYLMGLEGWSLLNVIIIAVTTLTYREIDPDKAELGTTISITFMLVTFVGIILFHVYLRLSTNEKFRVFFLQLKARSKLSERFTSSYHRSSVIENSEDQEAFTDTSSVTDTMSFEERDNQSAPAAVHMCRRETLLMDGVEDEEYSVQSSFHLMNNRQ